ncbi:hypothetical protein M0Q97_13250 [Candidatus Dojkabacteria bacterium]|jgi:hypothetical protein|nr:hypothetical protein [Candidatus Dojkabacteria bacterium]
MKIFEVIYTRNSERLTLPYGSPNTFYVKDDKVCFSIDIYIETVKDIVECKDENVIKETYNNDKLTITSIKNIGNMDYQFEAVAPSNYISVKSTSDPISSVFYKQCDRPCSDEVQERYQKNGKRIPTPTYSEF